MKLFILCLSLLTVGGLCKIDESCTVQPDRKGRSKPLRGTYQKRRECLLSGRAAFSSSAPAKPLTLSDDKNSSDKEDESLQCCVEIACGDNGRCRNNVEGNPCTKGPYLPNLNRARNLCPASTANDNVQCCSEKIDHNHHSGLRMRGLISPRTPQLDFLAENFDPPEDQISPGNTAADLGGTLSVGATPSTPGENTALALPPPPTNPGPISDLSLQAAPAGLVTGFDPSKSSFQNTDSAVSANPNPPADPNAIPAAPAPNTPIVPPATAAVPPSTPEIPFPNSATLASPAVPPSTPDIPLPISAVPNIRNNALNNALGTNSAFDQNTNPIVSLVPDQRTAVTPDPGAGPIVSIQNGLPTVGYQTNSDTITVSPLISPIRAFTNPGDVLNNGGMLSWKHRFGP